MTCYMKTMKFLTAITNAFELNLLNSSRKLTESLRGPKIKVRPSS